MINEPRPLLGGSSVLLLPKRNPERRSRMGMAHMRRIESMDLALLCFIRLTDFDAPYRGKIEVLKKCSLFCAVGALG